MISVRSLGFVVGFMSVNSRSTYDSLERSYTLSLFKATTKDLIVKVVQIFRAVISMLKLKLLPSKTSEVIGGTS